MSPILMELTPDTGGTFTATVVIAGIVIVMAVLFLLILIFQLFGLAAPKIEAMSVKTEKRIAEIKEKLSKKLLPKKADKNDEAAEEKEETASAPASAPAPSAQPAAEYGINGEIVAAISAAVAQIEGGGAVIRSIRKKNVGGRNPWANAANIENTKPF